MFTTQEVIKGVNNISQQEQELIKAYLQGAIYCWCNTERKYDTFYARDFLGGNNTFWEGTPVETLYNHYLQVGNGNHDYAFSEAAKAAGRLLKSVLNDDKRIFEVM
ncbi:MAG: hypothetical protein KBT34_14935 [Prevotella sp.]|nr:hypothetical protein [Candidatus Prevotella equi]